MTRIAKLESFCSFLDEDVSRKGADIDAVMLQKLTKGRSLKAPLFVSWEITARCNLECRHCRSACNLSRETHNELSPEAVRSLVDELADLQIRVVGLTGGEPLIRTDTLDIISRLKSKALDVLLYTNCTLVTNDVADHLRDALDEHDLIHISVDGGNRQAHDSQRGRDSFDRTMEGVRLLVERGLRTRLTCVPTTLNVDSLRMLPSLCSSLGVRELSMVPLMLAGRASNGASIRPKTSRLFDIECDIVEQCRKLEISYGGGCTGAPCSFMEIGGLVDHSSYPSRHGNERRICDAGTRQAFIDADGHVFPCVVFASDDRHVIGHVSDGVGHVWADKRWSMFREGVPMAASEPCNACKNWDLCNGGCMGLSFLAEGRLDTRDPRCPVDAK